MTDAPGPNSARRARRHRRTVELIGIDHVQLSIPRGEEPLARLFYGAVLGLQEVRKLRAVAGGGGAWFVGPGIALQLRGSEVFRASPAAHTAVLVANIERARLRLARHGVGILEDHADETPRRILIADPFGNRIELIDEGDGGFTDPRLRLGPGR